MKINKNIEKYKNYVRVALKDAYGFNEEEIKDACYKKQEIVEKRLSDDNY